MRRNAAPERAASAALFPVCPSICSVVVNFPDAEKLIRGCPANLLDYSMINIAPTNIVIFIWSVFILLEIVVLHCPISAGKRNIQEKHNISKPENAHFIFDYVKARCKKHKFLLLLRNGRAICCYGVGLCKSNSFLFGICRKQQSLRGALVFQSCSADLLKVQICR